VTVAPNAGRRLTRHNDPIVRSFAKSRKLESDLQFPPYRRFGQAKKTLFSTRWTLAARARLAGDDPTASKEGSSAEFVGPPGGAQASGSPSAGHLRPTLSAVAPSLRSFGASDGRQGPEPQAEGPHRWG